MDVRAIITVVALMCAFAAAQNEQADVTNSTSTSEPAKECLTAKNVSGVCVQRNSCDYSTGAIDLTLYAPHNYTRPCATAEVCCPQSAIVHVEPPSHANFDSDEDDDDNDD
ncbi:uncharacterized protein LOC125239978 [Leguminivora glycinivorella]|uniref:uncharacterized protein LOC125239978 n=1 Tax=Leguminivora glycinivorella TaxID=1035111 RepID=UPI00200D371A|nr:uncharacterized protein LOC125239978 [Leguminivora glycinivorella]